MAQTEWTATTDGDLDTATNWSNGVPAAGAPYPVVFGQTGLRSVTGSMDAYTALLLPEVIVEPGFTGDIGTAGAPFEASFTKFSFRGLGSLYLKQGSTSNTADLILDSKKSPMMQIGCNTAQFDRIAALNGRVKLDSTLTGTTYLYVGSGAIVTIEGANAITNVFVDRGGQVKSCNVPITTLYMLGGRWMQNRDGGAITTIIMGGDAQCNYQALVPPTLGIVGGSAVLDYTQDGREKTMAEARVFEGGRIKKTTGLIITAGDGYLDGIDW